MRETTLLLVVLVVFVVAGHGQTQCDPDATRSACGFIGVNQDSCQDLGCCWDTTVAPYCFEATPSPSPPPTPPVPPPSSSTPPPPPAPSTSYSTTFTFEGSAPFCAQCGANGAFACSDQSNWNDGTFFFTDQTPDGNVPVSVQIDILGSYACSTGPDDIGAYVNDFLIDIDNVIKSGDDCACDTCDGQVSFSSTQQYGLPIIKGGNNTLKIENFYNIICLNTVTLTVTYEVNDFQLEVFTKQTYYNTGASSSSHSPGTCGEYYGRDIYPAPSSYNVATFRFADPLPNNYFLVAANFRVYGRFWFNDDDCTDKAALNVTLGSVHPLTLTETKPTTLTAPENPDVCFATGCDHGWQFNSETLYQNGWPGYDYGYTNSLYVGNMGDGIVQVSRVDVIAYGYPQPN